MSDNLYRVEACGDCLGEWIPNGTILVADPDGELRTLRPVAIRIRDGSGPWARFMRSTGEAFETACKIYLGKVEGGVLVGQLHPPIVAIIPEQEVEALHPIVGRIGDSAAMTDHDAEALRLIAPFQEERCHDY